MYSIPSKFFKTYKLTSRNLQKWKRELIIFWYRCYLTKPQFLVCTFTSPFTHPLASVTLKKSRMICPDTRHIMQTLHILYTLGHKVGLFLWFPKISCSKNLLSLQPKLRAVFAGSVKENILPCKCSNLLIMWTGILKWNCFGQIFKELQNKYSEKPVVQKCAFVDLYLWLHVLLKLNDLPIHKFVFDLLPSYTKMETYLPLSVYLRDLEYSPYNFHCTFRWSLANVFMSVGSWNLLTFKMFGISDTRHCMFHMKLSRWGKILP